MSVAHRRFLGIGFLVAVLASVVVGDWFSTVRAERRDEALVNTIRMKLVSIPSGEFHMGAHEPAETVARVFLAHKREPADFADEYPRHRVRITRPFYLGAHEVTLGQFRQFVEATQFKTEAEVDGKGGWGYNPVTQLCEGRDVRWNWRNPGFKQTDEHPVVNVSWADCVAFCDWLSKKEKARYRLPTEAEWEYACRAGTKTRYYNGDDPDKLNEIGKVTETRGLTSFPHVQQMKIDPRTGTFTAPVGRYKPNAWGLYDMHGNVWEWCSDWHDDDYYATGPTDDPQGPDKGVVRVRRGGAWNSYPIWARASFRNWHKPDSRCVNLGFRVLRETTPIARR